MSRTCIAIKINLDKLCSRHFCLEHLEKLPVCGAFDDANINHETICGLRLTSNIIGHKTGILTI